MRALAGAAAMAAASRVRVAPNAPLGEAALLHAARALVPRGEPVRAGDTVGDLVVLTVEPAPGATLEDATEIEILPTARRADAPRVEVAILLDTSESMGLPWDKDHTRLGAALVAASSFLDAPGEATESVVVFHYAASARRVAGPARPQDARAPEAPRPKGSSDTAAAIDAALGELAGRTRAGLSHVILLLTDGVGGASALVGAAERAGRLRVPVHSLVFAPEVDPAFEELARLSGGSVQQAAHPLSIEFVHQPGG